MTIDLLIVGGGINGAAIAREAALNGRSVLLVERGDLAGATSSKSTKLIHGGLRYLEYYDFGLVREALVERRRLLKAAPHLIHPLTFVLPHEHAVRPWWMVRAGLLLYDLLAGRGGLPRSRGLGAQDAAYRAPLKGDGRGFVYSDAWVDDARLVVLNARDAADNGAEIATRTALVSATRGEESWRVTLGDGRTLDCGAIVNAAGPWVNEVSALLGVKSRSGARLIKGSHIIVPRLFDGDHAYILQQPDRRIVFAIPYEGAYTLIGTTDIAVKQPEDARIEPEEIAYLVECANRHFKHQIAATDVVSSYSGVRSLYDDGASESRQVTRDYVLELDGNGAPLLSVFGGKITTARHLAEDAMEKLGEWLEFSVSPVTRGRIFPGGGIGRFDDYLAQVIARWPFLGSARADRMARAYGAMLEAMLGDATDAAALGEDFGGGLTAREVDWLAEREWAVSADDILWRRTKLGLGGAVDAERLTTYLAARPPRPQ
ncbi:MAG: glycerol-3-phosphate dehydrogenase [Sphingomonas sp. SCN 67-18]|uniref:glycerol-3-phosphate dehydrogenase n=1 Tax=uncultured Sphingomonas sp. TaxID=158754 RepID=UPI00086A3661|nr:glycerol-3-phosphate dehydrogenase [Sphingomonas sp. SCN 67-18]ODU19921.1 MAG: glycerol-3-phosphate dehydrogenase [Sphingomonas sp. SCN 67-18]